MTPPEALNPQAREALAKFKSLVSDRFTGSLLVEFKDGVPMLSRTTDTHHYRKPPRNRSLDGKGSTG